MTRPSIRAAVPGDADAICAIYNHYVSNTAISLEEEPVTDMNPFSSCNQQAMPWVTAFSRYSCHSTGTLLSMLEGCLREHRSALVIMPPRLRDQLYRLPLIRSVMELFFSIRLH